LSHASAAWRLTAGVVLAALALPLLAAERVYEARVIRAFDGDTVWVQPLPEGRYRKLRLDGLDAPEICQDGGEAARDALAQRVLRQVVRVSERASDEYGRGLARLHHQGEDVGGWLVGSGHAWSYRWRNSGGPYQREEAQARAAGLGLFANRQAELPRSFRQRHGTCAFP
jgi:endonuclease YncB( thermonuclease family)